MKKLESARIMYEIYQESGYDGRYRVVYFTELNEHNKENEINRAMTGRHVYDGFIAEERKEEAKAAIDRVLSRMNDGEEMPAGAIEASLGAYEP